MDITV